MFWRKTGLEEGEEAAKAGKLAGARPKTRPTYPDARRQFFGVLLMVFTILALEAFAGLFGPFQSAGLLILLASILATYWAGLRAGLVSASIILAYVSIVYTYPISNFPHKETSNFSTVLTSTAIFFYGIVLIVGVVQGKLLKARIREYDAHQTALGEAEQRRQTEHSLQSSEEMGRLIVESAMDAIMVVDEASRISLWNPVAEATFGWSTAEAVGKPLFALIVDQYDENLPSPGVTYFQAVSQARDPGKHVEFDAQAKDGRSFPVEFAMVRHSTPDGALFVAFVRDISERRKAQSTLQETNDILERRVQERTAALALMYSELQTNKEAAEKANSAKSGFLSRLSHELRTPLNAILGFAQLLDMQVQEPSYRESIGQITRGGHHLLHLINEVLDLAKIEAGRISISMESVSVWPLIEDVVQLVRPLAEDRKISIEVAPIVEAEVLVLADRQRLTQILLNLLSNAVKYNRDEGTIQVRVCTDSGRVRIEVTDTGKGISNESLNRLFMPFERLGDTTIEGTGLGLALSKGLAEAMAGELSLLDSGDEGSTFALSLQVSNTPPRADFSRLSHPLSVNIRANSSAKRVLYIEDNPANVQLMKSLLESIGNIEMVAAMQGGEGLALARSQQPDLILLDLNLPDVHGSEVLAELVKDPNTEAIPVVIVSAALMDKMEVRLREAGAVAFLPKPLDVSDLIRILEDNLWQEESLAA